MVQGSTQNNITGNSADLLIYDEFQTGSVTSNHNWTNTSNTVYTSGTSGNITISSGNGYTLSSTPYTWFSSDSDITNRLKALEEQNEKLMEMLGLLVESEENLSKFPALKIAYAEYMFIRKIILDSEEGDQHG